MKYHQLNKLSGPVWYLSTLLIYCLALYLLTRLISPFPLTAGDTDWHSGEWWLLLLLILVPLSGFLAVTWYQRTHNRCNLYELEYWQKLIWAQRYLLIGFLAAWLAVSIKSAFF